MKCLTNLVGLDGCTLTNAPFTLNQIGYSKSQLEDMMDDSYATVDEFFEANKKTASEMIVSDIFGAIARGSLVPQIIDTGVAGYYSGDGGQTIGTGMVGIHVKSIGGGEYWNVAIDNIRLLVDYTGTIPVFLYDLSTGQLIATEPVEVVAGVISNVEFDKSIEVNLKQGNFWIGYDATGITSYTSTVKPNASCCGGGKSYNTSHAQFSAASIVAPYYLNSVTSSKDTGGMSIDYSIGCNNKQFICSIRSMFGVAMMWRTAMAVLDFSNKSGGQFSEQKTTNQADNEDRYMRAEYNYNKEIQKLTHQIRLPSNTCFGCTQRIRVETILPG